MKTINKYLTVALAASALASCADLDTQYYGQYVTTDQKNAAVEANAELAKAAVSAVFSQFGSLQGQYGGSDGQYDFGWPSLMIGLDQQTADVHTLNSGYNWFDAWTSFSGPNQNGRPTGMTWTETYKQIKVVNSLIATINADTENEELQFSLAQGLATRAFDYWVLAQLYQFNYAFVNPAEAKTVPIITEENENEVAVNGAPRATVQELYDQILSDISTAIDLITKSGLNPERVAQGKPLSMVSLAVAYGLRARVYLTMHKYAEAANDAQNAIDAFSGYPYSAAEISAPGFTSADDNHSWMWAVCMASTDRPITSGLSNFGGMFSSFNYGYPVAGGAWKWCNKLLYESIPATDARKGWWLDENYQSDHLTPALQAFLDDYVSGELPSTASTSAELRPYTQVKYGTFNGTLGEYVEAFDLPLMRIEEMYLILAEATGMNGGNGAKILTDFIKQYRDPAYICTATGDEFQEECWRQRRIELWGEGLAYFDIMRLNKGVDRTNSFAQDGYNFIIPSGDPVLIYCIPQSELTANPQITADDNNPTGAAPVPVKQ